MGNSIGIILVVISAIVFATGPIFARFAYDVGITMVTLLFCRYAIASVALLSLMRLQRVPFPQRTNRLKLIGLGFFGFVLQPLAFFAALKLIPAGLVVLLLYLYPVIVTLVSITWLKQPTTRSKLVAVALALGGTTLIVGPETSTSILGISLGIISAILYAAYVVLGSQILDQEAALPAVTVIITSATVWFGILAVLLGLELPTTALGWGAIVALGLGPSVIAVGTFLAGLKRIGAINASTLSTLEPVAVVILAALLLDEPISLISVLGGSLIVVAVVILARELP
jgi:drug/metabolite transporter (DMT)-like permease